VRSIRTGEKAEQQVSTVQRVYTMPLNDVQTADVNACRKLLKSGSPKLLTWTPRWFS
jgi:hypothetical protein